MLSTFIEFISYIDNKLSNIGLSYYISQSYFMQMKKGESSTLYSGSARYFGCHDIRLY